MAMCSAAFISSGVSSCFGRGLRRQAAQQLLQVQPRIRIGLGQLLLNIFFFNVGILLHLSKARQQPDRLNDFLFLQRNHPAGPCRSRAGCGAATRTNRSAIRNPSSLARALRSVGYAAERHHGNTVRARCSATARVCAFGSSNQLQQFLRIVQPRLELGAKRLRGDLRRDADVARQRIGCHELYFIDLDCAALFIARPTPL